MTMPNESISDTVNLTFAFAAQTADATTVQGTIDAPDIDDANRKLQAMQLRPTRVEPARRPASARPLSGGDFAAFNQQLAHLTAAGLPV